MKSFNITTLTTLTHLDWTDLSLTEAKVVLEAVLEAEGLAPLDNQTPGVGLASDREVAWAWQAYQLRREEEARLLNLIEAEEEERAQTLLLSELSSEFDEKEVYGVNPDDWSWAARFTASDEEDTISYAACMATEEEGLRPSPFCAVLPSEEGRFAALTNMWLH